MRVYFVMRVEASTNIYDERCMDVFESYKDAEDFFDNCVEEYIISVAEDNNYSVKDIEEYRESLDNSVPDDYLDACCDPEYNWCVYLGQAEYHKEGGE